MKPLCPAIESRHLSLRYHSSLAFEDVSLEIPAGQITAVVGPSGCGKSSFLRTLNRLTDLVAGCVVSGALTMDGSDLLSPDLDVIAHRRRVGMIFQNPNPFPFSIRRNLMLPLEEHGLGATREEREARIQSALEAVGLWEEVSDRLESPAQRLSGGQSQRLCISRALCLEPQVILLDEPTSALDPLSCGLLEDLILRLRARYTLVLVTHNLAQARRLADRVALFWYLDGAGRLIESGPTDQIFDEPRETLTQEYFRRERG